MVIRKVFGRGESSKLNKGKSCKRGLHGCCFIVLDKNQWIKSWLETDSAAQSGTIRAREMNFLLLKIMLANHGAAFGQKCLTEHHQASDLESSLSVRWRERKNPWSEHARRNVALPLHTLPDCIRYMMIPAASRYCCVCIVMQYHPKTQYSYGMTSAQIQLSMGQSRMVSGSRSLARCHDAGSCGGSPIQYIGNTPTQVEN